MSQSQSHQNQICYRKWSHKFVAVSAALPLSDLIVGVENVTPDSGNTTLRRVFSLRNLSKISVDVELGASFTVIYVGFLRRIGCT